MRLLREGCLARQGRLRDLITSEGLDALVLSNPKTIHWATGALVDGTRPHAFVLREGESMLVTNLAPEQAFVDVVKTYPYYTLQREFSRPFWIRGLRDEIAPAVRAEGKTGIEADWLQTALAGDLGATKSVSEEIGQLRRRKDADEIACMKEAVRITEAGYAAARRELRPGLTEREVYTVIEAAMVKAAGTAVELHGDFACGVRGINGGGPPTERVCEAGDLFILDLFPNAGGYVCDLCRTFSVGEPTRAQTELWTRVNEAHDLAGSLLRPGARCADVYERIREFLESTGMGRGSFTHHAGHGVGMDGWELPWLTPGSGSELLEGEVIACEPGLYGPEFGGGIRLEHNYLVTAGGAVPIDSFPFELR
jgi:Xaa-Pro aminopeptidase